MTDKSNTAMLLPHLIKQLLQAALFGLQVSLQAAWTAAKSACHIGQLAARRFMQVLAQVPGHTGGQPVIHRRGQAAGCMHHLLMQALAGCQKGQGQQRLGPQQAILRLGKLDLHPEQRIAGCSVCRPWLAELHPQRLD